LNIKFDTVKLKEEGRSIREEVVRELNSDEYMFISTIYKNT